MDNIQDMLVDEMRDILHAEQQLVKALPKMAQAAHSPDLKQAIEAHLNETKTQVERLQQAFELLGVNAQPKPCKGMQGIVEEGSETIQEGKQKSPLTADLELIGAAQRAEHYEISAYGTARAMARELGNQQVMNLLAQSEAEEVKADQLLTQLAMPMYKQVNSSAHQMKR